MTEKRLLRVLIVDDNWINLKVVEKMIESTGHSVQSCASGSEALRLLELEKFSLILMDCLMPTLDGYETAAKIRKMAGQQDVPIIALSSQEVAMHREECLAAGMTEAIAKPLNVVQLEALLVKFSIAVPIKPSPEHPLAELSILDREVLHNLFMLDNRQGVFLDELIELYIQSVPAVISELIRYVMEGKGRESKRIAHKLKGMCANLGALRIITVCERIELSYEAISDIERAMIPHSLHHEFQVSVDELKACWQNPKKAKAV